MGLIIREASKMEKKMESVFINGQIKSFIKESG